VRQGVGLWNLKTDVLEMLLAAGADPDPRLYPGSSYTARSFCADHFPECERELLPLLDAALRQRGAQAAPQAPAPTPVPVR
jgi:hypothetical protein